MSRILVVDDDEILVNTLAAVFRRLGHAVLVALDGETGLACARAGAPDVIILDVMMPDLDGLEVCRRLREHPTTRETPVLMFTALDQTAVHSRARLRGLGPQNGHDVDDEALPDDLVTKPVAIGELVNRVHALL